MARPGGELRHCFEFFDLERSLKLGSNCAGPARLSAVEGGPSFGPAQQKTPEDGLPNPSSKAGRIWISVLRTIHHRTFAHAFRR